MPDPESTALRDSGQTQVVLVDSETLLVECLAAALGGGGYRVVATATDLGEAIDSITEHQPDICIAEISPGSGVGIDGIKQLMEAGPHTLIVALTADASSEQLNLALAAGVSGYVQKTRGIDTLTGALQRVQHGEIAIEGVFTRQQKARHAAPVELARYASYLTPRERECLALLTQGHATEVISAELGVSRTTVRTHVQAVLAKLGVHSRLEAAALATRYGLLQ